ncbi:MAG: FAD:protein FMN transferase [Treponema sp.]|nr:FAD:protein FMN transferase [Treponema sp.]
MAYRKFLLLFLSILFFNACNQAGFVRAEFIFGTICSVRFFDKVEDRVYKEIFGRLREIDNRMSVNIDNSDVAQINAAAGVTPVRIHDDVFQVIERALYFSELSGGAFDITVGPLVLMWGISTDNPRVPSDQEIDSALMLINWRDVELDSETKSVFLKHTGMSVDLGAIAKGYAADEAAKITRQAGIKRAIINLGGNIYVCGENKNRSLWRVGIQNPAGQRNEYTGIVQTEEAAVVTSGVYERFFDFNGTRYHHIFSPFSGFPAVNGLLSVTIIAPNSMDADALSTAIFVMGFETGFPLIKSLPGIDAIFIFDDYNVAKTSGADFSITDMDFSFNYRGELSP